MKMDTVSKEYIKVIKFCNGKILIEIGDNLDGYNIFLTKQEAEKVIEMLQNELHLSVERYTIFTYSFN